MYFSAYRINRLAELLNEPWGAERIPDLEAVLAIARPHSVLEVGCFRGVSTEFWALHCGRVVAIDPWESPWVYKEFLTRVAPYPHVEFIRSYSPHHDIGGSFDLVYLDGDHSYECVTAEIDKYIKLIPPGGYIGGHDYTDEPTIGDGVKQAVDEAFGGPHHLFSDNSWLVRVPNA